MQKNATKWKKNESMMLYIAKEEFTLEANLTSQQGMAAQRVYATNVPPPPPQLSSVLT